MVWPWICVCQPVNIWCYFLLALQSPLYFPLLFYASDFKMVPWTALGHDFSFQFHLYNADQGASALFSIRCRGLPGSVPATASYFALTTSLCLVVSKGCLMPKGPLRFAHKSTTSLTLILLEHASSSLRELFMTSWFAWSLAFLYLL